LSPRELFVGNKIDVERDCKLGFGDYTQVHEDNEVTNTMTSRTTGAISLGMAGNAQGSFKFFSLTTRRIIVRRSWTVLPMPSEVVSLINNIAKIENEKNAATGKLTIRRGIDEVGAEIHEDYENLEDEENVIEDVTTDMQERAEVTPEESLQEAILEEVEENTCNVQ
jgi:hypothetical protein